MRRSLLFIPASSPRMLQQADVFEADAVIFDLEDAVSLYDKDAARTLLRSFLDAFELKQVERLVRINALSTQDGAIDLDWLLVTHIDGIVLPKADHRSIELLNKILDAHHVKSSQSNPIIIPIIETADALIHVHELALMPRIDGLILGAEDLATELGFERNQEGDEILLARSMIVLAAAQRGIDAIDTPYTDTKNDTGLLADTLKAKRLGMSAKTCIHPNQVDTINQSFSPSLASIEQAQKILMAEHEAMKVGKGAFSVDGKMIDKPIIERARKLIALAKRWHLI